ncbi:MAG: PHP domain-containing protein, partial [Acidimicrobiia bacterium]|nr:PHP domain-containing protein [Acidimicrobiia bacterium]
MSPPYAELHCHSNFSFRDGASWAEDLVDRAVALEYEALAITDHHGFYGAARMHMAAQESGLPIIYGTEITLPRPGEVFEKKPRPPRSEHKRGRIRRSYRDKPEGPAPGHHLVLLASDPNSYGALAKLVTAAQMRGQKEWPIYDWDDLHIAAMNPGIVALTGCWQGAVPAAAQQGDMVRARREAGQLHDVFGDRLFIELWHHRMPGDDERNEALFGLAAQLGLGTVATNNVHYHDRREADLSEVLAAIGGRRNLDIADGFRPATDERYLKSPEEMAKRFAPYPGAVETAAELGAAMAFDLKLVAPRLPDFPMPGHFQNEMAFLRHLTYEGAKNVYGDGAGGIEPAAKARLDHELAIIEELGFPGYFLVVWDLVQFARGKDI